MTLWQIRDMAERVRGIPLETVLMMMGARQDRYDKAKWHTVQGVIAVTGMKFMNFSCGVGGGGAIDLMIHLKNIDFKEAVAQLWHHFPSPGLPKQAQPSPVSQLILPPPDASKLSRVKRYMVGDRGISSTLVETLIQSDRLYADNRANAVFLLLGKKNTPVGAEMRGTSLRCWRGMAPGSRKDLGYFSIQSSPNEGIILCESAIDAISCFMLHPDHHCISTAGARPNPRWLSSLVDQGCRIYCGFDSDMTGERMASDMIMHYPTIKRLRPSQHDWNDVLKIKRQS